MVCKIHERLHSISFRGKVIPFVRLKICQLESCSAYLQGFNHVVRNKLGPIWATTTASKSLQDRAPPRDGMLGSTYLAARDMQWRILDRYGISEALKDHFAAVELPREFGWVDALHFRPFVYQEFNNVLLNMLCKM